MSQDRLKTKGDADNSIPASISLRHADVSVTSEGIMIVEVRSGVEESLEDAQAVARAAQDLFFGVPGIILFVPSSNARVSTAARRYYGSAAFIKHFQMVGVVIRRSSIRIIANFIMGHASDSLKNRVRFYRSVDEGLVDLKKFCQNTSGLALQDATIKLRVGVVYRTQAGITIVRANEVGAHQSVEDANQFLSAIAELSLGEPRPLLLDLGGTQMLSSDVRKVYTHFDAFRFVSVFAILVRSPGSALIGRAILELAKRTTRIKIPIQIFRQEELAIAWLKDPKGQKHEELSQRFIALDIFEVDKVQRGERRLLLGLVTLPLLVLGGLLAVPGFQESFSSGMLLLVLGLAAVFSVGSLGLVWWMFRSHLKRLHDWRKTAEQRISQCLEVLGQYAGGNYAARELIQGDDRPFNGLGGGIFMLGEELENHTLSRDFYEAVLNSMSNAVWITDSNERIKLANTAALKLSGYSLAEFQGAHILQFFGHRTAEGETAEKDSQWVVLTKSGGTVPIALTKNRLMGTSLEQGNLIWVVEDITEKKTNEALIAQQQVNLLSSERLASLGTMASGIAHEINNPLAIIGGNATLLEEFLRERGESDPVTFERLGKITRTVERIAKIIRGLRSFAREGAGELFAPVSVQNLIDDTLSLCQARLKQSGVELRINLQPGCTFECRNIQVSQVLLNLINNAFDAVSGLSDKWIEIDVREQGDVVEIAITDSGRGVPENIVHKIMTPFFTSKPAGKGTGLGLAISKRIVEEHSGRLYLDRASPHTRFVAVFPRAQKKVFSTSKAA